MEAAAADPKASGGALELLSGIETRQNMGKPLENHSKASTNIEKPCLDLVGEAKAAREEFPGFNGPGPPAGFAAWNDAELRQ